MGDGRWEKWRFCFANYNPWLLEEKWRTFWAEEKAGTKNFQLDFFIARTLRLLEILFRVVFFGGQGLQWGLVFVPRKRLGAYFLLSTHWKGGWNIPNRCYLCKEEKETTGHLLLFCGKVRMLWNLIWCVVGYAFLT